MEIHQYEYTSSKHQRTDHSPQAEKPNQTSSQLASRTCLHTPVARNEFITTPNSNPKQQNLEVAYLDADKMFTSKTDLIKIMK
jgi:hypothetical protein